ncbi:UNKNOWN [Stylonychia lemnae]|uniref:Uncharacterized protein n=1 Tax=Stylonychia lemnae TaxID=5949 RepID=A0A078AGB6_STYLE|nr:UNKNOWN [Stylonychia lemnae]|eukprot:CDW79878.1 UNKNOWN [Stylonychia lemnae]
MNKTLSVFLLAALLAIQINGQSIKSCTADSGCTNFDTTSTAACCATVTGTTLAGTSGGPYKYCDYTTNNYLSKYTSTLGLKTINSVCSSSSGSGSNAVNVFASVFVVISAIVAGFF